MSVILNLRDLGTPGIAVTDQCPVLFRKFPQNDHPALGPVVVDGAEICMVKRTSEVSHAIVKTLPTGFQNVIEGEVIIFFPGDHICSSIKHPYSKEYPLPLSVPECFRDAADLLCYKDLAKDPAMNDKTNVSPGRKKIKSTIFQHQTINSPADMLAKQYHMILLIAEGDIILS